MSTQRLEPIRPPEPRRELPKLKTDLMTGRLVEKEGGNTPLGEPPPLPPSAAAAPDDVSRHLLRSTYGGLAGIRKTLGSSNLRDP